MLAMDHLIAVAAIAAFTVASAVAEKPPAPATDKAMAAVKAKLAGKADMGLVSAAVKAALTK